MAAPKIHPDVVSGKRLPSHKGFVNLTDRVFEKLTVVRFAGIKKSRHMWLCRCECGAGKEIAVDALRTGATTSCGCVQRAAAKFANTKHGKYTTPEYRAWQHMKERCSNPECKEFGDYGGRGIRVCDRWLGEHGFENFFSDMGERPSPDHTLDRFPDNNGHYEPNNCRWATMKEQQRNRRVNRIVVLDGKKMCISEAAAIVGITKSAMKYRVENGIPLDAPVSARGMRNHLLK